MLFQQSSICTDFQLTAAQHADIWPKVITTTCSDDLTHIFRWVPVETMCLFFASKTIRGALKLDLKRRYPGTSWIWDLYAGNDALAAKHLIEGYSQQTHRKELQVPEDYVFQSS